MSREVVLLDPVKFNSSLSAKLNSLLVCLGNGNLKQMKNAPQHHQSSRGRGTKGPDNEK